MHSPVPVPPAADPGPGPGRRRRRAVALRTGALLAGALLAGACAGGNPPAPSPAMAPGSAPEAGDPGPTPLRVAFVPATTVLPLHVAQAQGIFERNGLAVTLEQASNISDLPATLGRQFDLALGTATDLIRAGAAGIDVVQVVGNTVSTRANPFVQVMVAADSGITDVAQLAGKTVGSPTLSGVIHAGTVWWARQRGADPGAVRGVEAPSPNLPDQLRAGRVDAVEALEPFATILKREGYVSLGDPFAAIADPIATNFWVAQGAWARANGPAIERFARSLAEAREFVVQQPEEARRILQSYTGMPAPVAASVPLPTYTFEVRPGDLAVWAGVLRDIGQHRGTVDVSRLVVAGSGR